MPTARPGALFALCAALAAGCSGGAGGQTGGAGTNGAAGTAGAAGTTGPGGAAGTTSGAAGTTGTAGTTGQGGSTGDVIITIKNGGFWNDTAGKRIEAHGAGLIKVGDTWYWIGEDRSGNSGTFRGVNAYASKDLSSWE